GFSESEAVTQETPPHFRYVVGKNFHMTKKEIGVNATVPLLNVPGYLCSDSHVNSPGRTTVGGEISVKFSKQGSSMSALVPGQGPLVYRACIEEHLEYLRIWFANVQTRAWKWANTF